MNIVRTAAAGVLTALSIGTATAESLQGSWSACSGARVVVDGNTYTHYHNGSPVDAGLVTVTQNGALITDSQHGQGRTVYGFEFRSGKLILMESPQVVYKFWRTRRTAALDRCECVAFEDYWSCLRTAG